MSSRYSLYGAGENDNKQLGGSTFSQGQFNKLGEVENVIRDLSDLRSIHTSQDRTAFVTKNGANAYITSKKSRQLSSIPSSDTLSIIDVQVGKQHILILTKDGKLYAYGGNDYGQLGYKTARNNQASQEFGTVHYSDRLKQIKPAAMQAVDPKTREAPSVKFSQIAVGYNHNLALTNIGTVYTWGNNESNQLGVKADENNNRYYTKTKDGVVSNIVELLSLRGTPIRQIIASGNTSYLLSHSGDVYAFGDNSYGQLGFQGAPTSTTIIHRVPEVTNKQVVKISAGLTHVLALTKERQVYSWGSGKHGQLGFPTNNTFEKPSKQYVTSDRSRLAGSDIIDIATGTKHSVFLKANNKAEIFGISNDSSVDYPSISPVPGTVKRIFAGESRCFFLTGPESSPYDMDTSEDIYDDNGNTINIEDKVCPVIRITGELRKYKEEKQWYSYSAILNVSFLKKDHYKTNMERISGIDFVKLKKAMDTWAGLEDKCREENAIVYVTRDLLPSLSTNPPCIEAIRVYMILPLLPHFNPKTTTASSIQAEYCTSFLNLPKLARRTLRNWFIHDCPKEIFQKIVQVFTKCVSLMCLEHSKSQGNISVRTPVNPQNHRSYEITDHPDPTTLVVANRATVAMLKFLGIMNYINEKRTKPERIEFKEFYLDRDTLSQWDWTDDWTRRCEERHSLSEFYTPEALASEIEKMDNYNLAFSQRKSFKDHFGENEKKYPDQEFDTARHGFGRDEQHFNLCAYPFCMDPKSKAKVLQIETKTAQEHAHRLTYYQNINATFYSIPQGQDQPVFQLYIHRDNIVESTFRNLMCSKPQDFKKPLTVKFANENARDAEANETAGVRREFFMLILMELLSEKNQYGMFKFYKDSNYMWFSDHCYEEIEYYQLIGIICGLALYNDNIVDIHFPLALYKMLLGEEPNFDDFCMLDPTYGKSLMKLRNAKESDHVESWDLDWTVSEDHFGESITRELVPGGSKKTVTFKNREEYINKVVEHRFKNERSMKCFTELERGFKTVLKDEMGYILNIFRPEELMTVVVGDQCYNWEVLKNSAKYSDGYEANHPNIKKFWQVFMSLKEEKKKDFLQFLTGSSKIPISGLQIYFQKDHGGEDRLPQAHTCFNLLDLPEYSSTEIMKKKLLTAIADCEGFQFI